MKRGGSGAQLAFDHGPPGDVHADGNEPPVELM
jgi:hypothetical protein